MSVNAELIGILRGGVALGGLVLALQIRTDKRLATLGGELAGRVGRVEQRMTWLKVLIEGTG